MQNHHRVQKLEKNSRMASKFFSPLKYTFLALIIFTSLISLHTVECVEFNVGGDSGWATPAKNDQLYNDWASKNRFLVNDTLKFQYKKDSVMAVTEQEYEKCRSAKPAFFSNNGDTVFTLDHPGLYYFISGVSGHCQRGMKMIVKVLEPASPPQAANDTSPKKSAAVSLLPGFIPTVGLMLVSLSLVKERFM